MGFLPGKAQLVEENNQVSVTYYITKNHPVELQRQ